jgi:putative hemin transport protein
MTERDRFAAFRRENPTTRIRTAARELGTSEAALVATGVDGEATRLRPDFDEMLHALEALGEVMALTRNDACVHEKTGLYAPAHTGLTHRMAQVLGADIDLRLFLGRWRFAYAVAAPWGNGRDGLRRSLQFFDAHGDAVHKVFATRKTDEAAFAAVVERFAAAAAGPPDVEPRPEPQPERSDAEVDRAALLADWAGLQDTHDFFPLLGRHGVTRTQALRLAEGRFTERVAPGSIRQSLEAAAAAEVPIMVFVGNRGCVQIHTGPVRKLVEWGGWYNVLDPGFNLHLDEGQVAESWVVVKPTEDGDVTALELYDAAGAPVVQLFGERKPGRAERPEWRAVLDALPRAEPVL